MCLSESQKVKVFASLFNVVSWHPRALLAVNEVNVCVWNCTPLIGGSVHQVLTLTSFIANVVWGVLPRTSRQP